MRMIVATDQWFPDLLGGVARYATDVAVRWGEAGHDVTVLAPQRPGLPEREVVDGGPTVLRALPRGRLPQTATDTWGTWRAAAGLGRQSWDVAVAHTCTTAVGLMLARVEAPLVYVFHADPARESRYEAGLGGGRRSPGAALLQSALGRATRAAVRAAKEIVVLSEFSAGLVRDLDPGAASRTTVISGAVDVHRFQPGDRERARARLGIEPGTRLVLTVRRLAPRMGLPTLLEAFAAVAGDGDVQLAIGGIGPLERELKERSTALGVDGCVRFLGSVSDTDLPDWYRAADVFVLPTTGYEGFGLVTAEALASGTPVVGTTAGATPELIGPIDPDLLAVPGDPDDLSRALRLALERTSPALRALCRERALAQFSWDVVMPGWEAVLGRCAARRLS